jgi:hypothetical protein
MMKKYRLYSVDIKRGRKFLQIYYPDLKVTFKDSLSFIPSALRYLSEDFKIPELKKGHFPHRVVCTQFIDDSREHNFRIPLPERSAFETDFGITDAGIRHHEEAEEWLDKLYEDPPDVWDFKEEAIDYCISDVLLLGKAMLMFRKECLDMTTNIQRPTDLKKKVDLDPFVYTTLPSAIMAFYLSQLLPLDTIAVIDRYSVFKYNTEIEWLSYMRTIGDMEIDTMTELSDVKLRISGYCREDNIIFVFLFCYDNGCPKCFSGVSKNVRERKSFQELYDFAQVQLDQMKGKYNVEQVWECDWLKRKSQDMFVQHFLDEHQNEVEAIKRLDPREAYRGGKSEMYKFIVNSEIQMVDFVSQYPTSMLGTSADPYDLEGESSVEWFMPVGSPTIYFFESLTECYDLSQGKLGVCKVQILPPRSLYAPFLSYRVRSSLCAQAYEVLYGLCKRCMDFRSMEPCHHSDCERSFIGVWTIEEIRYAISLGYKVLRWFEVWEYPSKSSSIFRDFIIPFMVNKICSKAKGLVQDGTFTEKGLDVVKYLEKDILHRSVTPQEFVDNPARRTVAKLIQNAFTGKWGQKENYGNSVTFFENNLHECHKLLHDGNVIIKFAEVLNNEGTIVQVDYIPREGSTTGHLRKNDHIVAHITAYGRIMLNKLENVLDNNLIYCDTDSAYHIKMDTQKYKVGFKTGDLELELPLGKNWRGLGRKSYAYEKIEVTTQNETKISIVSRQKGIPLKLGNMMFFTPTKLHNLIMSSKDIMDTIEEVEETSTPTAKRKKFQHFVESEKAFIEVDQTLFVTEMSNTFTPTKRTVLRKKRTKFQIYSPKRVIQWNYFDGQVLNSFPFGYTC